MSVGAWLCAWHGSLLVEGLALRVLGGVGGSAWWEWDDASVGVFDRQVVAVADQFDSGSVAEVVVEDAPQHEPVDVGVSVLSVVKSLCTEQVKHSFTLGGFGRVSA